MQTPNFEIPTEMRDFAEKSVDQARNAVGTMMANAVKAAEQVQSSGQTFQSTLSAAVAKGFGPWRVVGKHMLRNSLIPVVTYLGLSLGYLMGGAVIIEGIFNLPGLGNLVYQSIQRQEGPVVVGVSTLLVLVFILTNLLVDLLYGVLDPRIRYD